jgi:hypothetical protein
MNSYSEKFFLQKAIVATLFWMLIGTAHAGGALRPDGTVEKCSLGAIKGGTQIMGNTSLKPRPKVVSAAQTEPAAVQQPGVTSDTAAPSGAPAITNAAAQGTVAGEKASTSP